jgi:hypothetical protein
MYRLLIVAVGVGFPVNFSTLYQKNGGNPAAKAQIGKSLPEHLVKHPEQERPRVKGYHHPLCSYTKEISRGAFFMLFALCQEVENP